MTWKRIGVVATLVSYCTAWPSLSQAQEAALTPGAPDATSEPPLEGKPVTLAQVIERARVNPPAVLSALATLERFQAQEHLARAAYLPKMTLGAQGGVQ